MTPLDALAWSIVGLFAVGAFIAAAIGLAAAIAGVLHIFSDNDK